MKRYLLLFFIFNASIATIAQTDSVPPYLRSRTLPQFRLMNNDSVAFTQKILQGGKATIFMLFDPECDHCKKQLDLLLSLPEVAEKAQVVMVSLQNFEKNRKFYRDNRLDAYPFIHLGRDQDYFFGPFYRPGTVPVLVFYDKNGKFVQISKGNAMKDFILKGITD